MRRTSIRLVDGRELIYFDEEESPARSGGSSAQPVGEPLVS